MRRDGTGLAQDGLKRGRSEITLGLRQQLPELEAAISARVFAVSDPRETGDSDYVVGVRTSLSTALEFALATIERGEDRAPAIPTALLSQAGAAARNRVTLETVLRRYMLGHSMLMERVVEEAERLGLRGPALHRILRSQSAILDKVIAAVSQEHSRERALRHRSPEERHAEMAQRLLDGEIIDGNDLNYDLDRFHLGLVGRGPGVAEAIRDLAIKMDKRLLVFRHSENVVWAWLGSRHPFAAADAARSLADLVRGDVGIAVGEPARNVNGWRLSHRQAKAALAVAVRGKEPVVRYSDVAVLASMLQDDLLITSLRELFLRPLLRQRDGGEDACRTLRAYFEAGFNVSSAAAALGVNRNTVANRIKTIETALGRPLVQCTAELQASLLLAEAVC